MKLGVVDIGSNAIRFQVTNILKYNDQVSFKKMEYIRFPLRLGEDVFHYKAISKVKEDKFVKLMQTFKILFELYEVNDYMICATSAMRESQNGAEIVARVQKEVGVTINVIDGTTEADYINNVVFKSLDERNYLHIDVGGGSTELNFYVQHQKIASESFKIGSVRRLQGKDTPESWELMHDWVMKHLPRINGPIICVGTGGNIGKIHDLAAPNKKTRIISRVQIEKTIDYLKSYSIDERINVLMLNPDRADVIVPASEIYLTAMRWAKSSSMLVPEIGLKDGIIQMLYEKNVKKYDSTTDKYHNVSSKHERE
jgi:exopolyphosphatase/guanosine-5'-triphosphate,3'-diphosphate pyrophosphatase